jgi:hypothetical protein
MRSGSYPRRELLPPEPSQSARRAITVSLPTVLALILLPAIAFASPPDPSWVAGIYDGADGDDVVSLVYETSAAHAAALSHPGPLPCLLGISLEGIAHAVRGRRFTCGPRSPPVVSSTEFGYVFSSLPPPLSGTEELVTLPSNTKFPVPVWRLPTRRSLRSSSRPTDQRIGAGLAGAENLHVSSLP